MRVLKEGFFTLFSTSLPFHRDTLSDHYPQRRRPPSAMTSVTTTSLSDDNLSDDNLSDDDLCDDNLCDDDLP